MQRCFVEFTITKRITKRILSLYSALHKDSFNMNNISSCNRYRYGLLLLLSLISSLAVALEHSCGLSSTPCQAGCWNPSARLQANGLRLCEVVSLGYYSPDEDDAQYACQSGNAAVTGTTACNPCFVTKNRLGQGVSNCSPFNDTNRDSTQNSADMEVSELSRRSDGNDSNKIGSLKYVIIFSLLAICFVYVRARIIDCKTRQKNSKPRPIPPPPPPPPTEVRPNMSCHVVVENTTELGDSPASVESSVSTDIEQGQP